MKTYIYILIGALFVVTSCQKEIKISGKLNKTALVAPDYTDVTIPYNIAPMNFKVRTDGQDACVLVEGGGVTFQVMADDGNVSLPAKKWREMAERCKGGKITFTVCLKDPHRGWLASRPFYMNVASEPCDPYVAYRLIEPAYEMWNEMGIYQRNVENFDVSPIIENTQTEKGCVNCHSFAAQNPDEMLFHVRKMNPGMMMMHNGKLEKLDTKTDKTISPLVYPSWHPSGKYVAFSTNHTELTYHLHDPNAAEVYDDASDVVVYDVEKHQIFTLPQLSSTAAYETFPTFSADGRTFYFCTAPALPMPQSYAEEKYSLCSVSFNPETGTLGTQVDTLFNARTEGKSLSFPRFSPDGKWLMFTRHAYGSFPIWHKDADLWMINLQTKASYPLTVLNSDETDSYHSWSSNSRWVIFSSRRLDGWYTRLFIAYIDKNGQPRKPFMLPQESLSTDINLMKSYNLPEFVKGKVNASSHDIATAIRGNKPQKVTFR